MSEKNHPNFHVAKFATEIIQSFYDSLRGKANTKNAPDVRGMIVDFVTKIEEAVDTKVGE